MEVSFFLIDENRFRHNESGSLGGEDCGSTQHILLLDEFYRTAVRFAGKRILWNMVPCDEEEHYDDYVMTLYAQGVLTPNEWLDLGGLSSLSAEAVRWCQPLAALQEYRFPIQSGAENTLLEAYSWEYPAPTSAGERYQTAFARRRDCVFGLDPYCMMLQRVTEYLTAIEDFTRLDLGRRCLFKSVRKTQP